MPCIFCHAWLIHSSGGRDEIHAPWSSTVPPSVGLVWWSHWAIFMCGAFANPYNCLLSYSVNSREPDEIKGETVVAVPFRFATLDWLCDVNDYPPPLSNVPGFTEFLIEYLLTNCTNLWNYFKKKIFSIKNIWKEEFKELENDFVTKMGQVMALMCTITIWLELP